MKAFIKFLILSAVSLTAGAQVRNVDSLKALLKLEKTDTGAIKILSEINGHYNYANTDSAIVYGLRLQKMAAKLKVPLLDALNYARLSYSYTLSGDYPASIQACLAGLSIAEDESTGQAGVPLVYVSLVDGLDSIEKINTSGALILGRLHYMLGYLYMLTEQPEKGIEELLVSQKLFMRIQNRMWLYWTESLLSRVCTYAKRYEDGLKFGINAYNLGTILKSSLEFTESYIGKNLAGIGDTAGAKIWFREAIGESTRTNSQRGLLFAHNSFAEVLLKEDYSDSALWHVHQALRIAKIQNLKNDIYTSDTLLASIHLFRGEMDSAYYYLKESGRLKNELFGSRKAQDLLAIVNESKQHKADIINANLAYRRNLVTIAIAGGLFLMLCIALFLWRNNRQRMQANEILSEQKGQLEKTLVDLQSAQAQLVQSEKMASLGELTAGIAHEIQNPLNFVNNFSEVSYELMDDLNQELDSNNIIEAKTIGAGIKKNLEKIINHGKRADSIVKGMLQHSRNTSGVKEATDINALVDEYVKLAFHGWRAKDNAFNATVISDYDASTGSININSQDIGRVVLNLVNNAFYAINEKKKVLVSDGGNYDPTVWVTTKRTSSALHFIVKDNGIGMSKKVLDKIFQPFFTTKPTGEGTGLGLSLSYDIVKSYNGELKASTVEGEETTFLLAIPA